MGPTASDEMQNRQTDYESEMIYQGSFSYYLDEKKNFIFLSSVR